MEADRWRGSSHRRRHPEGVFDKGVNFVGTGDIYTNGESEKTLAEAIKRLGLPRKAIVIATKAYGRTGVGRNDIGASRAT